METADAEGFRIVVNAAFAITADSLRSAPERNHFVREPGAAIARMSLRQMDRASGKIKTEPLPASLDLVHLARQTGGDALLQRELLEMFRQRSAELVHRMQAMAGEPEPQMRPIRDLAHQLKGSALAIGAFSVAAAAERVESAFGPGPSGQKTARTAMIEALAAELATAICAIEGHFKTLV